MEKKIPVKTFYLLLVISIGLIGLGIGSTYAVFTATAQISNPITLSTNLAYEGNLIETISVTVPSGETVSNTLNITNSSSKSLNYVVWYTKNEYDVEIALSDGSSSGNLASGDKTTATVDIKNNEDTEVTIILGISSSSGNVVLSSGMQIIQSGELSDNMLQGAALYITNLYLTGNPTQITQGGSGDKYYYASSVNLMNDGFDSQGNRTNSMRKGNIRYYGANPDNYIYFNCSDYDNQNDSTCERWRIIGVFDGKLKIMRDESIGGYSWDYNSDSSYDSNWYGSTLKALLNDGYYNNLDGNTYYNNSTTATTINFNSNNLGIKNIITKFLISESTWNLGGSDSANNTANVSVGARYIAERKNTKCDDCTYDTTWTGNVGLIYTSDYGYASDLSLCNVNLNNYGNCKSTNWMFNNTTLWTINSYSFKRVWGINSGGGVALTPFANEIYNVHPVVYLNSDVVIDEGDGSSNSPYKLSKDTVTLGDSSDRGKIKDYITNLYASSNPTQMIAYKGELNYDTGEIIKSELAKYFYSTSVNLMNDGLDNVGNFITDTTALTSGTQGNIRYYGATPNNYIYFNCDDYSNQNDDTCEKWRIIGVFDGKVKIIRDETLGYYSWYHPYTTVDYAYYWYDSTLQKLLNNGYYNNLDGISYYNGSATPIAINFKTDNKGIKDNKTRKMISESTWYLGSTSQEFLYANQLYGYERGLEKCSYCVHYQPWTGKIGLMYASDYGFASDLTQCSATLYDYYGNNCAGTNWLFNGSDQWLITPCALDVNYAWGVLSYGFANYSEPGDNAYGVRAVLYLEPELGISSVGNGSIDRPYQIAVS